MSRIAESTIYEVNFDLWGFSVGWCEAIIDAMYDFAFKERDDQCDSCNCPANVSVNFKSPSKERVQEAIRIFKRLENLANKTKKDNVHYELVCG